MKSSNLHISRWVAGVALVVALVAGGVLATGLRDWVGQKIVGASASLAGLSVVHNAEPVSLGSFQNGFASVLKPALPAVVNIHTSKMVKQQRGQNSPFFNDPFFQQFFGDQFGQGGQARPQREQSLGSGVIVTPDGTILTNNHVIDGATDIEVDLSDKREFKAKLVGTDAKSDVAVLKIDATGLPTLALGDSSHLQVGDVVFAIGDPFGVGETATMGIVSATGRNYLGIENGGYEDFIQTDASINPGNSGGAMIDLRGNLVGINTAIITGGGGGNQGIGFAIPVTMAKSVMDQIVEHGKVVRGYLGVYIQGVDPTIAKQFGAQANRGALIGDVSPDAPGAKAGLKRGDIVTELNGQPVESADQLRLHISQMAPGTQVKLGVMRDGKMQDINVTLGELPADKTASNEPNQSGESGGLQGVEVQELTPDVANELNLGPGTRGVVVSSVDPSSPAAEAGISRGDVIQEVNHKPVTNIQQYRQAVAAAGSQPVLVLVNHNGVTQYRVIQPQ